MEFTFPEIRDIVQYLVTPYGVFGEVFPNRQRFGNGMSEFSEK